MLKQYQLPDYTPVPDLGVGNYPVIGPTKAHLHAGIDFEEPYLYLGAGESGIVRDIWALILSPADDEGAWSDLDNWYMRVWVDTGDIADPTAPGTTGYAVSIPLAQICGTYERSAMVDKQIIETPWWTVGYAYNNGAININWRMPMPFSNGILVQFGVMSGGNWTVKNPDYMTIHYETGKLPNTVYADYRLKSSGYHNTVAQISETWTRSTLMTESSGAGVLMSLMCAGHGADWSFLEGKGFLMKEPALPEVRLCPGGEDIFVCTPYYGGEYGIPTLQNHWGVFIADANGESDNEFEFFRHYKEPIIHWQNGCTLTCTWSCPSGASQLDATVLYYQKR